MLQRLRRRLLDWLRPPRTLRPTRPGWVFFALTFGVGFAALNTGNNLLYMVLSLLLAFLVLSGVLSESALRGVRIRRRLPREIHAGRAAPVVLEVHNDQRRASSFAVVVEDRLGTALQPGPCAGRIFALRVGPGETQHRVYPLLAGRRGPLELWGFRVTTRFPFGLFSKTMRLEQHARLLVYPAIHPLAVRGKGRTGRRTEGSAEARGGQSPESAQLRAWAPGDSVRRVHWRSSLRRAELLVRDPEQEQAAVRVVRLRTAGVPADATFEAEVCRAASEVVAYLAQGFRVALHTDTQRLQPESGDAGRRHLLALLARVQAEPAAAPRAA